jgi:hypothetical protein
VASLECFKDNFTIHIHHSVYCQPLQNFPHGKLLNVDLTHKTNLYEGPGFELVGAGACRGPEWQDEIWPKEEGAESLKGCAADCERDPGCTAFDVWPSEKAGKYKCINYGHDKVVKIG